jgi:hypothetical protein
VVNKVEAVIREIARWLEEYEKENGVSESVKRRRKETSDETHPCPSKEGMHSHSASLSEETLFKSTVFDCKSKNQLKLKSSLP